MVNQRDSKERKKFITLMVLPHNSTREVFRVSIPYWLAGGIAGILLALVLIISGIFLYSSTQGFQWIHYQALLHENKLQEQQIKAFFDRTKELEGGIRDLEERDQELREMLGLQKPAQKPLKLNSISTSDELQQRLVFLGNYINTKKDQYKLLKEASVALVYKFDAYPSVAPVYGHILSTFGWRIHPFTGQSEMHEGVDIPVWVGYPVKSAADGLIVHAGWSSGYGETVIIDHGNGYKTIYGHNSRVLVKRGQKIYKGQVVAKAGSTGLSTGPHCHYQVEYHDKAVSPIHYLDLNIRSARYI